MDARRIGLAMLVAMALAGCETVQLPAILPAPAHGQPFDPGPAPDALTCEALLRQDIDGAVAVRTELNTPGLGMNEDAARAAAADPEADVLTLGIPVTADEMAAVRTSGVGIDSGFGVSLRANSTLTHRYGGVWIDPPGSDRMVVSVVGGDQASADLIGCVQGTRIARFVVSGTSLADGQGLADRAARDWDALRRSGIEVETIDWDETREVLVIAVSSDLAAATRELQSRYGRQTEVVSGQPIQF